MTETVSDGNSEIPVNPKSDEVLQAQLAAFAADQKIGPDREYLFNTIGELIEHPPDEVVRPLTARERERLPDDQDPNALRHVADKHEFVSYLRAVGGAQNENIAERASLLERYKDFAPYIRELQEAIADPEMHVEPLGTGDDSSVYLIEVEDRQYAVRIPHGDSRRPALIDRHVRASIKGADIARLEHVVMASYEEGITVSDYLSGQRLNDMEPVDIMRISQSHLEQGLDMILAMHQRGLNIDLNPRNFLYDPQEGFAIVDYDLSDERTNPHLPLDQAVRYFGIMLLEMGISTFSPETAEDFAVQGERLSCNLQIFRQYAMICEREFHDNPAVLAEVRSQLKDFDAYVASHSDPAWVERSVERARLRKEYLS